MIDVIPAPGMQKDFSIIKERILQAAPYTQWIHVDIADNTIFANETFRDFDKWQGMPEHLSFEAHLMVANPEKYIRPLVKAGFKRLIAHVECQDPRHFLDEIKAEEVEVGLALDGPNPIEDIEPFIEELDVALIMGIETGFSGQEFMIETLDKLRAIHEAFPEITLEVDGGINAKTAPLIKDAGTTRLAVTSFLYKDPSRIEENIRFLQQ